MFTVLSRISWFDKMAMSIIKISWEIKSWNLSLHIIVRHVDFWRIKWIKLDLQSVGTSPWRDKHLIHVFNSQEWFQPKLVLCPLSHSKSPSRFGAIMVYISTRISLLRGICKNIVYGATRSTLWIYHEGQGIAIVKVLSEAQPRTLLWQWQYWGLSDIFLHNH